MKNLTQEEFEHVINEMIQALKKVTFNDEVIVSIGPKIPAPQSIEEALKLHRAEDHSGIRLAIASNKPFLVATTSGLINQCLKAFGLTNAPPMLKAFFLQSLVGLTEEGIDVDKVDISQLTDLLKRQP